MIGIYFSGTGNTRHCVERFVSVIDKSANCFSIENNDVIDELPQHDMIVFGYPIYYSNIPKIVKDFVIRNKTAFDGKKVFIICSPLSRSKVDIFQISMEMPNGVFFIKQ